MAEKHIFSIEELDELCKKFPTPNHFMGSVFQNAECETMVIQSLQASKISMKEGDDACSFRTDGVFTSGQCVDNGSAYKRLLDEGYFLEERRRPKDLNKVPKDLKPDAEGFFTLIFITDRLFHTLMAHK